MNDSEWEIPNFITYIKFRQGSCPKKQTMGHHLWISPYGKYFTCCFPTTLCHYCLYEETFAMLSIVVFSSSFLNTILTLKSGDRMPKLKIILQQTYLDIYLPYIFLVCTAMHGSLAVDARAKMHFSKVDMWKNFQKW